MLLSSRARVSSSRVPAQAGPLLLQRKWECGRAADLDDDCAECRQKRLARKSVGRAGPENIPPIVHEVLRSPGQPLDAGMRGSMETRFGHDFGQVRIHFDAKAGASAEAINALAYTVNQNIVFGPGQYQPGASANRSLLAHELAHTMQQVGKGGTGGLTIDPPGSSLEQAADGAAHAALTGHAPASPAPHAQGVLQRQPAEPSPSALSSCRIHFVRGSTEFTDAREFAACMTAIRTYLETNPDGNVILHGYASEEGEPDFNQDLSRRRAEIVRRLLGQERIPLARVSIDPHGADRTYPMSEENRRVEVVLSREISFPDEQVTVPRPPQFVCGPNVTTQVHDALSTTRTRFGGWAQDQQREACDALDSLLTGGMAWDVVELHNNAWILGYRPACATQGATPRCGSSVQIGSGCHYAGSVNYVVFGAMCKLCWDHFVRYGPINTGAARFTRRAMLDLIDLYKGTGFSGLSTPVPNFRESQHWAEAGYDGWPSGGATPSPDRANCAPGCPTPYTGSSFQVNWYPRQYYTGSNPIIPPEDAATP